MKSNPFLVIPMMLRAARPSRTHDMPAVALPFWIRKGYDGLTFFGHIITHSKQEADAINQQFNTMKNHEMIHLYQARSTHDSWLCFYWLYFVYWLKASRYCRHLKNAGYRLNPFEMEAYAHMDDLDYLNRHPNGCTEWRTYAALPLSERLRRYRQ
ncbi:MAG: hypothetical protein IKH01_14535 [Prevotella sp.]|nr:hypothetical protein [Prevotella sp.]MBR3081002.1 hypothetical protein [Prevotella sp.]